MTNQTIYDAALRLAYEFDGLLRNEDYEDRSKYFLPIICHSYASLDATYRQAFGLSEQQLPNNYRYQMTEEFPLCDAFFVPTSLSLAAKLVMEEAPEIYEKLATQAELEICKLQKQIPFQTEPIVDRYAHLR